MNKQILMGLYLAPSVVAASLKTAVLTSYLLEKEGYEVSPKYQEERADIVETITFHDREKLIRYVQAIQNASAIDGPLRSPYIAYQQGSLTYAYGRLAIMNALRFLK